MRNGLEFINIFTDDGKINENGGSYLGMMRMDARNQIYKDLKAMGLIIKTENNKMSVGICQRSKDIVEPLLKPQWYVNCQTIGQRMIDVVKNG